MNYYGYQGNEKDSGAVVAAWVWGHRLRTGQHWMEYLLEFLNVLAGFDYRLGQGTDGPNSDPRTHQEAYQRFRRLGLRRFVFYDEQEKTPHPLDDLAIKQLREALETVPWMRQGAAHGEPPTDLAKKLLRSFTAVEDNRSWYAKALLPAHHEMLLWEASRKGATLQKNIAVPTPLAGVAPTPEELDKGIAFDMRNFFARGGELYYLMLSAGTRHDPQLAQEIESGLATILKERNQVIGKLARTINELWDVHDDEEAATQRSSYLGWIYDPDCAFYRMVAEDVRNVVTAPVDALEALDLLAHLIAFHMVLYIYHRAQPMAAEGAHATGACGAGRPTLVIDAQEGASPAIRSVAATTFRSHDVAIREHALGFIRGQVQMWAAAGMAFDDIVQEANSVFSIPKKKYEALLKPALDRLEARLQAGEISIAEALERYMKQLEPLTLSDFERNFRPIHAKLARGIGFVAPQRGPNQRYVLSDTLLRALTLALVPTGALTYHDFLARLYARYGLVIGIQEARASGIVDRKRINTEHYQHNAAAFLAKLHHAGLAVEYSDATAMVSTTFPGTRK